MLAIAGQTDKPNWLNLFYVIHGSPCGNIGYISFIKNQKKNFGKIVFFFFKTPRATVGTSVSIIQSFNIWLYVIRCDCESLLFLQV